MAEELPPRNKGGRPRGADWTHSQLAMLVGVRQEAFGRWMSGDRYPSLPAMLRIHRVFGWEASEQVKLIPFEGRDERYGMVLRSVVNEWIESEGPRMLSADEIRSIAGHPGRRKPNGGELNGKQD